MARAPPAAAAAAPRPPGRGPRQRDRCSGNGGAVAGWRELTGKELPITTLSALNTVDDLKQEVASASGGTNVKQLQLALSNQLLSEGCKTLGEYGVGVGSMVNVVVSSAQETLLPRP